MHILLLFNKLVEPHDMFLLQVYVMTNEMRLFLSLVSNSPEAAGPADNYFSEKDVISAASPTMRAITKNRLVQV